MKRKTGPKLPPDWVLAAAYDLIQRGDLRMSDTSEALRILVAGRVPLPRKLCYSTVRRWAEIAHARVEAGEMDLARLRVLFQGESDEGSEEFEIL